MTKLAWAKVAVWPLALLTVAALVTVALRWQTVAALLLGWAAVSVLLCALALAKDAANVSSRWAPPSPAHHYVIGIDLATDFEQADVVNKQQPQRRAK